MASRPGFTPYNLFSHYDTLIPGRNHTLKYNLLSPANSLFFLFEFPSFYPNEQPSGD